MTRRLSNTPEASVYTEVLEETMGKGHQEVFRTD